MENRLSYALVGAFVFVLLIGAVVSIIWLGNYSDEGVFKFYKVITNESVSGLNEKAPVKLRGVQIGEVRSITINPKNSEEVLITIRIEDEAPIKQDTYAIIEGQGITGLSYIQLQGGTNISPSLKTSNRPEEYGRIFARPSTLARLDRSVTALTNKAEIIFDRMSDLISNQNIQNIEILLENSAKISASTQHLLSNLEAKNREFKQLLEQAISFEKAAIEAANGVKTMSNSLTTAVDKTGIPMMNNVKEASQSVKNVMGGLNEKMQKGAFDIDIIVKENMLPLNAALSELTILLNETKDLVDNLKSSPSDILFKEGIVNPAPNEKE